MAKFLTTLLLALLLVGCGPWTFEGCIEEATTRPTHLGVYMARAECNRKFPKSVRARAVSSHEDNMFRDFVSSQENNKFLDAGEHERRDFQTNFRRVTMIPVILMALGFVYRYFRPAKGTAAPGGEAMGTVAVSIVFSSVIAMIAMTGVAMSRYWFEVAEAMGICLTLSALFAWSVWFFSPGRWPKAFAECSVSLSGLVLLAQVPLIGGLVSSIWKFLAGFLVGLLS